MVLDDATDNFDEFLYSRSNHYKRLALSRRKGCTPLFLDFVTEKESAEDKFVERS